MQSICPHQGWTTEIVVLPKSEIKRLNFGGKNRNFALSPYVQDAHSESVLIIIKLMFLYSISLNLAFILNSQWDPEVRRLLRIQ